MIGDDDSPFHEGERLVHRRVGVTDKVGEMGRKMLRDHLIQQHIDFYPLLPLILIGAPDPEGRPWASALFGEPGFVRALDPYRIRIAALPAPDDPIGAALTSSARLGMLGIELHTRRRNRLNGRVLEVQADGLIVGVQQSFGNCPKYIQTRELRRRPLSQHKPEVVVASGLDEVAKDIISRADTFFIASVFGDDPEDRRLGADVSHRGGATGFVRLEGANRLIFPDYIGNNAFQTLGNISMDPRVGLIFLDFEGGALLQVSGRAEIVWAGHAVEAVRGAQRLVSVTVEHMVRRPESLPLSATFLEWSPALP
jgi:predicted pyridoxine 5'-phosphate oxidase superfamily flavin-nucleotide-binding protein